jgi:hypothetical protein
MLFCQLAYAQSLREICGGWAALEGKLRHLGIADCPKATTLSYANAHRPWELYRAIFDQTLARCQAEAALRTRRKFRFKHKLLSLDSSMVELCAETFDWARYKKTKGALKLHLVLDHDGCLPCYAVITEGQRADVQEARTIQFAPGTMVVFDRGQLGNNRRLQAQPRLIDLRYVTAPVSCCFFHSLGEGCVRGWPPAERPLHRRG